MHFTTVLFISASSLTIAAASPLLHSRTDSLLRKRASAVQTVDDDHVLTLTRQKSPSVAHAYLLNTRARTGTAPLIEGKGGQDFLTSISFGTETFDVIVDTGSSDTWVAADGFTCVDFFDNSTLTEEDCAFGKLYSPSSTLQPIPNENFNVSYGDGEYLNGYMAYETVSLAGVTVPKQEVGIVDVAGFSGDGNSSGLLGLAFPSITSAFPGDDPAADQDASNTPYSPIFTTMYRTGLTNPVFSIALSRDESGSSSGGILAIGGMPSSSAVTGGFDSSFASTQIQTLQVPSSNSRTSSYTFYVVQIDGISYGSDDAASSTTGEDHSGQAPWYWPPGRLSRPAVRPAGKSSARASKRQSSGGGIDPSTEGLQVIIDTGTTLVYLPSSAAYNFNSLWDPPAFTSRNPQLAGLYLVECDATPPSFDVMINGQTFGTNAKDLVTDLTGDGTICASGIQDGGGEAGEAVFIMGDVWLKNVLAVFDLGNSTMSFASRVNYPS